MYTEFDSSLSATKEKLMKTIFHQVGEGQDEIVLNLDSNGRYWLTVNNELINNRVQTVVEHKYPFIDLLFWALLAAAIAAIFLAT